MTRSTVSRRRFIKIAGAAGVVLVAGGAAGYYALTNYGPPPTTQKVTTTVTEPSRKSSTPTRQATVLGNSGQDLPQNIGLRMQYQETSEWCWIAVATSINHFYNPASTLTQGDFMTIVGQTINKWPSTTLCSPSAADLKSDPDFASILADPYTLAARYVLNKPNLRIPEVCVKTGGVGDALDVRCNRNSQALGIDYSGLSASGKDLTLATITKEMEARRPIAVDLGWKGGGQHCVAIAGVMNDMLLICDPIYGESAIQYKTFPDAYRGGASWVSGYLTKAGSDVVSGEKSSSCVRH